ncbi:hypothetical protein OSB04_026876 [Centaurea solstitialis]|uniref:Reverse transcriptase Ty1/copia-type domain-containing protein n=1 Tax=Centaurea solstitialis TaxID=347529 RepID=A0AA38SQ89_9ASTR|nr:hypothetical protein OSB04_026876 [Centaurea solstitialis]
MDGIWTRGGGYIHETWEVNSSLAKQMDGNGNGNGFGPMDTSMEITKGKSRLLTSVSFMLGIANLQMHQMDVKIDLLNEDLEEIYMEQPKEFVAQGKENKVCKLVNTLYGLKQAPKQ